MMTIWKYSVDQTETTLISAPAPARPVSVGVQDNQIVLWMEVDVVPDIRMSERGRVVHAVPTGGEVPPFTDHIGTVTLDAGAGYPFVVHVYIDPIPSDYTRYNKGPSRRYTQSPYDLTRTKHPELTD